MISKGRNNDACILYQRRRGNFKFYTFNIFIHVVFICYFKLKMREKYLIIYIMIIELKV